MFCDLVGSTALSQDLDPEEFGDIIQAYRELASAAIGRYGGYVARYVGDGILAYFGYPRAHGDDAIRATHAALDIVNATRTLAPTLKIIKPDIMSVRVGLHTGLVVVGELGRGVVLEKAGVVGETPNVAARLIELAAPNAILISGVTLTLLKNVFECREFGSRPLKGLSRPINIYEVVRARDQQAQIEFAERMDITRLTGRDRELEFLNDRWRQVLDGTGRVVSIVGEPGIGKSRLTRAFAGSLSATNHLKIVFHCSPHFSNSAFFPVIDYLNRWLDATGRNVLESLADAAGAADMFAAEIVPILASLLSVPLVAPYQAPQETPKVQRDRTMEFFLKWIVRQSADRPILIVIEDLHWSDASSLELILLLLQQIHTAKILLLLTFRPDFRPPWHLYSNLTHLPLDRLKTAEVHEMITHITGGECLPEIVRNQLAEKTDGVPLFIEELTKAVVESHIVTEDNDHYQLRTAPIDIAIPVTLHATLMARLDSLGTAKIVAQLAAVIGRQFSYQLLRAISAMSEAELNAGLAQLVEAELLFQHGLSPRANYLFKHSMIQETAYLSLLRSKRAQYHRQIADVFVSQFPDIVERQPELVAHHYSAARMPMEAVAYWGAAGQRSLTRSANVEALAHIDEGLRELTSCPQSPLRTREEVTLLITRGAALTASRGYGAQEVAQTYAQARELCRELDEPLHLFPALRGLHSFYLVHGPLSAAREMVEQLQQMAEQTGNSLQLVEAHRRLGWCLFCMGQLEPGERLLNKAIKEYDSALSSEHIVLYGSDPCVVGLVNLAWLEWFAGRARSAIQHSDKAIALARTLSHNLSLAYALGMSAALYQCLGEPQLTSALAEETIALAERHGFPYWVAWETALLGWARTMQGQPDSGGQLLQKGLASYRETGSELFCSYILGLFAQIHARAHRFEEAIACCDEALWSGQRTDVHFFDSEIHRLKGNSLLNINHDVDSARACFEQAVATGRNQGAKMLELRGAISLASLCRSAGKVSTARDMLSKAISGFDDDQPATELEAARRLLDEMGL